MKCWAWSGRASRLALRSISEEANGESSSNGEGVGRGLLGGQGKLIETGKGKFGMDIQFVGLHVRDNGRGNEAGAVILLWETADAVEQSPDGQQLALATETGHVMIFDTETQAVTAMYTSHAMAVRTMSLVTRLSSAKPVSLSVPLEQILLCNPAGNLLMSA